MVESDELVTGVADWLIRQALSGSTLEGTFSGCVLRLQAAGIMLSRASVAFSVLHPLYEAQSIVWHADRGMEISHHSHEGPRDEFEKSPFNFLLINDLDSMRRRLAGEDRQLDFPLLEQLQREGNTDYLAYTIAFEYAAEDKQPSRGVIGSWSTQRSGGFTEREIRALKRIEKRLAVALKVHLNENVTRNILKTYLGPNAGEQVMAGSIKRGDGNNIPAVIWFSDLRQSTRMAEQLQGHEFLELLNQYFECTAGSVTRHGGEVLRFVGDAVLAIFPVDDRSGSIENACRQAIAAVSDSEIELQRLNSQTRLMAIDFGIGLHLGKVLFGNIGIPERLEFSVIGPAANMCARLEELTKKEKVRIVASKEFVAHAGEARWRSLGSFEFKGLAAQREVYTLDQPGADA